MQRLMGLAVEKYGLGTNVSPSVFAANVNALLDTPVPTSQNPEAFAIQALDRLEFDEEPATS